MQHLEAVSDTRNWSSWHLHVQTRGGQALDQILRDVVAPVATMLAVSEPHGQLAVRPWFFIRYWQNGPHLRLRIADLDAEQSSSVTSALTGRMDAALSGLDESQRMDQNDYAQTVSGIARTGEGGQSMAVGTLASAGVLTQEYEPEIDRYGGRSYLGLSENLFHSASVAALRACLRRPSYAHHLSDGLEAMAATMSAWPADRGLLLRRTRDGWSDFMREAGMGNATAVEEFATKKAHSLASVADQLIEVSLGAPTRWSGWTGQLASACELWLTELGRARAAGIFASHLHMMQNRLEWRPVAKPTWPRPCSSYLTYKEIVMTSRMNSQNARSFGQASHPAAAVSPSLRRLRRVGPLSVPPSLRGPSRLTDLDGTAGPAPIPVVGSEAIAERLGSQLATATGEVCWLRCGDEPDVSILESVAAAIDPSRIRILQHGSDQSVPQALAGAELRVTGVRPGHDFLLVGEDIAFIFGRDERNRQVMTRGVADIGGQGLPGHLRTPVGGSAAGGDRDSA